MDDPHFPRQSLIDTHDNGGFRFAGMSHRGSLLCLPDGIWAWPVTTIAALTEEALGAGICPFRGAGFLHSGHRQRALARARSACARDFARSTFRSTAMTTGPAVRTYNVMLMESRRVGAGLIAAE